MEKEKESNTEIINSQRVVDRLDFQLLITVIFFFISAWAFLNNKICNFTDSEPATVQMDYILVHYILSLFLIYSIVLAAYKSYFIKNDQYVVKDYVQLMFNFYLDTWIWILLICIIIIVFAGVFDYDWFLWFIIFSFYVALKICDNYPLQKSEKVDIFHIKILSCVIPTLIIGFILFLSSMTSIINIVSIKTDKPFYSFSDKVYITVDARGYACRHKLVGLSEEYKDSKYYVNRGLIVLNATQIKNNEIGIATISPTTGFRNFCSYMFYKARGEEIQYLEVDPTDIKTIRKKAHLTPKTIYVKP